MSKPLIVTDPATAAVFTRSTSRQILFAFMRSEQSLTSLQRELGFSVSLLHYHATKLRRLRLVTARAGKLQSGRTIILYAAAAEAFLVQASLEENAPSAERRARLDALLQRDRARHPTEGTLYDLDAARRPRMRQLAGEKPAPSGGEWWWRLNLTDSDRKMLAEEIRGVFRRYQSRATEKGRSLTGYVALAAD